MKIVVLAGGLSPERNVSLSSGVMVAEALRGRGHKALFYVFYPAHVYVFYALSWGLYLLLN